MNLWRKKETSKDPEQACWFCKKSQRYVRVLVAGPDGVNICEDCVHICDEILARRILEEPGNRGWLDIRGGPEPGDPESVRCGLCRMPAPVVGALSIPDRGVICGQCADAVRAMPSHGQQ